MNHLIREFEEGSEDTPLQASRMNEIVRTLNALRNLTVKPDGSGKLVFGERNAVLELTASEAAAASGDARYVPIASIAGLASDYIGCTIDGSTVQVALPWNLRAAQKPSADHERYPEYAVSQYTVVVKSSTGTGVGSAEWIDVGVGRHWARDLEVCIDDVPYHGLIVCGPLTAV